MAIWPGGWQAAAMVSAAADAHIVRAGRGAHAVRNGAGERGDVGGERGINFKMRGGVFTDDADDGGARFAGVMEIREAVAEPGTQMEKGGGGASGDARVAVGCARTDAFKEAEHAAQSGHAIERGDEMHLRRAGIHETMYQRRSPAACVKRLGPGHTWQHTMVAFGFTL